MSEKPVLKSGLPDDSIGHALADVYFFLLRKAGGRKRVITAKTQAEGIAGNLLVQPEITAHSGTFQIAIFA
jgi:hypothetical protein